MTNISLSTYSRYNITLMLNGDLVTRKVKLHSVIVLEKSSIVYLTDNERLYNLDQIETIERIKDGVIWRTND